jgi:hypothetical protein
MKSAVEGSGEDKGLSEKMDSDEKEKIQDTRAGPDRTGPAKPTTSKKGGVTQPGIASASHQTSFIESRHRQMSSSPDIESFFNRADVSGQSGLIRTYFPDFPVKAWADRTIDEKELALTHLATLVKDGKINVKALPDRIRSGCRVPLAPNNIQELFRTFNEAVSWGTLQAKDVAGELWKCLTPDQRKMWLQLMINDAEEDPPKEDPELKDFNGGTMKKEDLEQRFKDAKALMVSTLFIDVDEVRVQNLKTMLIAKRIIPQDADDAGIIPQDNTAAVEALLSSPTIRARLIAFLGFAGFANLAWDDRTSDEKRQVLQVILDQGQDELNGVPTVTIPSGPLRVPYEENESVEAVMALDVDLRGPKFKTRPDGPIVDQWYPVGDGMTDKERGRTPNGKTLGLATIPKDTKGLVPKDIIRDNVMVPLKVDFEGAKLGLGTTKVEVPISDANYIQPYIPMYPGTAFGRPVLAMEDLSIHFPEGSWFQMVSSNNMGNVVDFDDGNGPRFVEKTVGERFPKLPSNMSIGLWYRTLEALTLQPPHGPKIPRNTPGIVIGLKGDHSYKVLFQTPDDGKIWVLRGCGIGEITRPEQDVQNPAISSNYFYMANKPYTVGKPFKLFDMHGVAFVGTEGNVVAHRILGEDRADVVKILELVQLVLNAKT